MLSLLHLRTALFMHFFAHGYTYKVRLGTLHCIKQACMAKNLLARKISDKDDKIIRKNVTNVTNITKLLSQSLQNSNNKLYKQVATRLTK